jgi:hypothetical protein
MSSNKREGKSRRKDMGKFSILNNWSCTMLFAWMKERSDVLREVVILSQSCWGGKRGS